jgi:thiazole tautomerase (transcriptional regulator TenI)
VSNGYLSVRDLHVVMTVEPFIDFFHIREKNKTAKEIYSLVQQLHQLGFPLSKILINDRVDVAAITSVRGTHLAYHSVPVVEVKQKFPKLVCGKSVHDLDEAILAEKEVADYIIYGHIFASTSKKGVAPRGIHSLKEIINCVSIPVIAIGGITPKNVKSVMDCGVQGVAIISSIWEAEFPLQVAKEIYHVVHTL